ncbi:MAG: hypothetical protein RR512_05450 [Coprobacillus sp.]
MKKILCFILSFVFLIGCSSQEKTVEDKDLLIYKKVKDELVSRQEFDADYPFDVRLTYNSIDNKYYYDIIIDNVTVDMYYVKAVAFGNESEEQICPNVGIFDDEVYHLKKSYVDKVNHFYKGFQLSGTSDNKQTIRVYVGYYTDEDKSEFKENYIEVKDEIR